MKSLARQLTVIAAMMLPVTLHAQSVLNFPRAIQTAQVFTGIAVSNPTPSEVTLTLTAFQPDGGFSQSKA